MQRNLPSKTLLACLALPVFLTPLARADYPTTVLSDNPVAYYRLNDDTTRTLINKNSGTIGAAGDATNDLTGIVYSVPGAIVGDANRAAFFDFTTRTEIPFNAVLNPPNTEPFTIEAWLYPASDQTANGQSPLANRWTLVAPRQGWVFFQRKPDSSYNGSEPVGWNCRMYNGIGTSGRLDVTSLVPYQIGKWQHVVVVYDPVQVTNATLAMYIDGQLANTHVWTGGSGTDPGYMPVTSNLSPQPAMALGNYNNANSSLNPWYGAVDEFALYTNGLTAAQILSHYQNGTNANRATPYSQLILSHNPAAYLGLNETAPGADTAVNLGDLRSSGHGAYTAEVNHPAASPIKGQPRDGAASYHLRNGNSTTTLPFRAENNPDASVQFAFEAWLRPTNDRQNPGASPVNNRYVSSGNRTGWVIFQRAPNSTYTGVSGYSGVGWTFRMFTGSGGGGQDVTTGNNYTIGDWQHLVVTWEPHTDVSPAANGGVAWQGNLTAYINGVPILTNTAATYCANTDPTEDATPASDLAVGSYNAASGLGANPFEGDVDEVAIYNGFVLTPEMILEHYKAGTNANYGTNYETLVMADGLNQQAVPGNERTGHPKTYWRFNDRAPAPAANSGSLGYLADGNQVTTTNTAAGPRPPSYPGFEASNAATPLNGLKQWASLNNPSGLNISGQISLEAWVKPDATQNDPARIISHGPPTYSEYLLTGPPPSDFGAPTNGNEVFLKVEGATSPYYYTIGAATFTNGAGTMYSTASFLAPAADFGAGNWVHLVGTYDGANWRLYRNGAQVAISANAVGALPVINGDWAIGSTGNGWANNFAGVVDEAAIYNYALTPDKVAAHYSAACPLQITPSGGNVTVTWCSGTLQAAGAVTGTYTNVTGALPPSYSTPASGTLFFRVQY